MKPITRQRTMRLLDRVLIGTLFLIALLLMGIEMARAGEVVPAVGWSHAADPAAGQEPLGANGPCAMDEIF